MGKSKLSEASCAPFSAQSPTSVNIDFGFGASPRMDPQDVSGSPKLKRYRQTSKVPQRASSACLETEVAMCVSPSDGKLRAPEAETSKAKRRSCKRKVAEFVKSLGAAAVGTPKAKRSRKASVSLLSGSHQIDPESPIPSATAVSATPEDASVTPKPKRGRQGANASAKVPKATPEKFVQSSRGALPKKPRRGAKIASVDEKIAFPEEVEADKLGFGNVFRKLLTREDVQSTKISPQHVLEALKASDGLLHKAKDVLLTRPNFMHQATR